MNVSNAEATGRRNGLRSCHVAVLLFAFGCHTVQFTFGNELVKATLKQEVAWTGEPVSMMITLYSPGPFSGVARFDLPEISQTAIMKIGSPVVSSEVVGDATYLTQQHEFRIYTQLDGKVVVPSFEVQFSGAPDFNSSATLQQGATSELRFESKRPPGMAAGMVVVAKTMRISQSWIPDANEPLQPGDVIARRVSTETGGTTAMMLPPVDLNAPNGVRVYGADPIVEDETDRGSLIAKRLETVKYQFESAGTFDLPGIEFVRWDPEQEKVITESLSGKTVIVEKGPQATASQSQSWQEITWPVVYLVSSLAVIVALIWRPARGWILARSERSFDAERKAAQEVRLACASDDPSKAYSAVLKWERLVMSQTAEKMITRSPQLDQQMSLLGKTLFSDETDKTTWSGHELRVAFRSARRGLLDHLARSDTPDALPELNPA